jgi:hypothetical protein
MRIYKFKNLTDEQYHCHFLQIVLEKSIWCASPDSLNDEDEFKFELDYKPSPQTAQLLARAIAPYDNLVPPHVSVPIVLKDKKLKDLAEPVIAKMVRQCRALIGITSFSLTKTDDHLWEEYGGRGNGVCIEINIPDHLVGQSYHQVDYVSGRTFHVDLFLESVLNPAKADEVFRKILLTKTKKWTSEEEIRLLGKQQNVEMLFDGHINEITFGPEVPTHTLEKLMASIGDHCNANGIKILRL